MERTGTSGRRDQWVKEISCCRPTWPVLRLYSRFSKGVYTCVSVHFRVNGEGQQQEKTGNFAELLFPHHLLHFPISSHWGGNRDLEHSELLASQPSESALEPYIRWFRSKWAHIFTFVKWGFCDCRGLWDMFENKCRGLANLPERRPSPFKSL